MPAAVSHTVEVSEGERADFPGLRNRYVLRGERTDGRFALVEHRIPPKTLAAPVHVHEHEDEYSFVLTGRLGAQIGDDVVEAGPGTLVLKPRGVPHAFWNAGDEETRLLEIISPAGFEQFFADLAPHRNADQPDLGALAAIQAGYGLLMDFASAEGLKREHGLEV